MTRVRRLQPTAAVLRELYLKSGNQCAFPGCTHPIVNSNGNYVGQVCHIEAAEEGGQRFNPNPTNEERRALSNLMLLCYDHHIETNNVQKYTVDALKKMKRAHEAKFSDIVGQLQRSISDLTTQQSFFYTESGQGLFEYFDWNYSAEEAEAVVADINVWVDKLRELSPDTRQVFSLMLKRSSQLSWGKGAILDEIEAITGKTANDIKKHVILLNKYGFISEPEKDDGLHTWVVLISELSTGWQMWLDIKDYCEYKNIDLDEIIVELNFKKLD